MRKRSLVAVCAAAALAAVPALAAGDGTLNEPERAFLIEQMELSKSAFLASISGLSEAQWRFKPAPNVWSVAECAEHIVLSETYLFDVSQQVLKTPAVARPDRSNPEFDRQLAIGVQDRSHKATAPEPLTPSGKLATPAEAARAFTAKRDSNEAYVKSTSDDLRIHVMDSPAGKIDAYQFLVLMATHTARHTAQIKEVQGNANYPAK